MGSSGREGEISADRMRRRERRRCSFTARERSRGRARESAGAEACVRAGARTCESALEKCA